jgi:Clustered mitochondria/Translation initiation factor eIF3 subunit 135
MALASASSPPRRDLYLSEEDDVETYADLYGFSSADEGDEEGEKEEGSGGDEAGGLYLNSEGEGDDYGNNSTGSDEEESGEDEDPYSEYFYEESAAPAAPVDTGVPAASATQPVGTVGSQGDSTALWVLEEEAPGTAIVHGRDNKTAGAVHGEPSPTKSGKAAAARDWNAEFQELLDLPDGWSKYLRLRNLESDFVYAAEAYGRIIIAENVLPDSQKSIRPVSVGGVAGGSKFICAGILFKFSDNSYNLYDSEESAMKTASHELRAAQSYYHCGISELRVPLMAFITYRGWRLVACSLLPLSSDSLVYGSNDAGRTVKRDDAALNGFMDAAASQLKLKRHMVGPPGAEVELASCCDIEGHRGLDGRFYLLDFARVAPPQPPQNPGDQLHKLFRLEFVRKHSTPLSSDGFSRMGRHNRDVHNHELIEAFRVLTSERIPALAEQLDAIFARNDHPETFVFKDSNIRSCFQCSDVPQLLHAEGVNLRLLGLVRRHVTSSLLRRVLLTEMVARLCKSLLHQMMRTIGKRHGLPSDEPYRRATVQLLNLLVGNNADFWTRLKSDVEAKYPGTLSRTDRSIPLREMLWSGIALVNRVLDLSGIRLSHDCDAQWRDMTIPSPSGEAVSALTFRFSQTDVDTLETKVSHLNLIDLSDGMALFYEGRSLPRSLGEARVRLHKLAQVKLQRFVESFPGSLDTLSKLGEVFMSMASDLPGNHWQDRHKYFRSARLVYEAILKENCADALRSRVVLLQVRMRRKLGEFDEALEELERFRATCDASVEPMVRIEQGLTMIRQSQVIFEASFLSTPPQLRLSC